ncbi:hypothetical protein L3i22_021390 [Actinoplanes sp. L3-i22]|nr:hypothetical protein L3i22_021390 [Actinoplanes sp. L3-i22]
MPITVANQFGVGRTGRRRDVAGTGWRGGAKGRVLSMSPRSDGTALAGSGVVVVESQAAVVTPYHQIL